MILLAIESATELVGVALADERGHRAGVWATGRRRHAEALGPAIAHVLEQAGVSLPEVTAVAVDVGPGLFTGLRVGLATAKGLAQGLGIGVLGLTSLEVLGRAAFDTGCAGPVAAVVDARRGEVFASLWHPAPPGPAGPMREVVAPALYRPDALVAQLERWRGEAASLLAVGDGAHRYAGELRSVEGVRVAGSLLGAPSPDTMLTLAGERLAAGAEAAPPGALRPLYLRDADAHRNWVQRSALVPRA